MKLEKILKGRRDEFDGWPSAKFVGRKYQLIRDYKFGSDTFLQGTIIEFAGIRVSTIPNFPNLAFYKFPDNTLRHADLRDIKLLRK